jgi:xylulokinase
MLLLGIDLGTSSIKVSVLDLHSQELLASASYPESEAEIISIKPGWAEQSPEEWWQHTQKAILKAHQLGKYNPTDIAAIGISYQMHGLVCVDKNQKVIRNSIIWCDSRAVPYGEKAFNIIGAEKSLSHLLNSPGNFTAAKLAWVKEEEPELFRKIDKIMLPGDFLAMKLTGEITTSASALSEGIFWDFKADSISKDILAAFGFEESIIPDTREVFTTHGYVKKDVAGLLSLKEGIPVTYKAGDQPNNAFSLNILQPGEIAATAGTSGVVYGVTDKANYDPKSRVNSFAHVNYTSDAKRIGVLLCINGTGILNSWLRKNFFNGLSYDQINREAASVNIGADGLLCYPFGNGAERVLENKDVGASIKGLQFNQHQRAHVARAAQEGIVCALNYGMEIMKELGMKLETVRAGHANMFLSEIFSTAFANTTGCRVELYNTDGSIGAARAAGLGAKLYKNFSECFTGMHQIKSIEPKGELQEKYGELYGRWREGIVNRES